MSVHFDAGRRKGHFNIGTSTRTRSFDFDSSRSCECGAPNIDREPCACLLLAARGAGIPWSELLREHNTVERWKSQYRDLPTFDVPGTHQLGFLPRDDSLCDPVAFPTPRGRPKEQRLKRLIKKHSDGKRNARHADVKRKHAEVAEAVSRGLEGTYDAGEAACEGAESAE